jgi:hypothetical protein
LFADKCPQSVDTPNSFFDGKFWWGIGDGWRFFEKPFEEGFFTVMSIN